MRLVHGEKLPHESLRYASLSRTPISRRSYSARYLGHPETHTNRLPDSKPSIARRSGTCSVSYQSLNSSSTFGGGSMVTRRKPLRALTSYLHFRVVCVLPACYADVLPNAARRPASRP